MAEGTMRKWRVRTNVERQGFGITDNISRRGSKVSDEADQTTAAASKTVFLIQCPQLSANDKNVDQRISKAT